MREIDGTAPSHQPVRSLAIIVPTEVVCLSGRYAFELSPETHDRPRFQRTMGRREIVLKGNT
jgi:hypothetical protein